MDNDFVLKIGSTYSGAVDAFGYAANEINKMGGGKYKIEWQIELERQAHVYLKKNYPDTKKYYYDEWHDQYQLTPIDILCGGDPCQPNSVAGNRRGQEDNRFRWPHYFSLAKAMRPRWVINENVTGSIGNMVLDQKITDLESIGYTCQPYIIPASSVGAFHTRRRVFLIANSDVQRRGELLHIDAGTSFKTCRAAITLGTQSNPFLQFEERENEPAILPVSHGIPDQIFRLGWGNANTINIILVVF